MLEHKIDSIEKGLLRGSSGRLLSNEWNNILTKCLFDQINDLSTYDSQFPLHPLAQDLAMGGGEKGNVLERHFLLLLPSKGS